jgi:hypothetical protein
MTTNNDKKITQFSGDEYIKVGNIAKSFFEKIPSSNPPKLIILMGGIGAGKTTMRRAEFGKDYVNLDFGEIDTAIRNFMGKDHPRLIEYSLLASDIILKECILEKKNIVIEIIGDNYDQIAPVITKMKEVGYEVQLRPIISDLEEALKRHLQASKEDKNYISAYYTQEPTLSIFFNYFGLGEMPTNK